MNWYTIGLSIMATQASAITFLSTPGQAFESGLGFVQFYFGLPIAMIIISAVFLPIYYKLKVFTAYEYLEQRFDVRIRLFTAFLFLVSRGLAAGITIYAPSIILSTLLGWNLGLTNVLVGLAVIIYTVSGGTRAVSLTQKWQMAVIFFGMFVAFGVILSLLPDNLNFANKLEVAGVLGKLNAIDTSFDLGNRYTLLSGLTGGLFLSLSYFGTDQSQVQRYLGGKSLKESRMGLMFNGLLKVPMQFFILSIGVAMFVFYQFNEPPTFFNASGLSIAKSKDSKNMITGLESEMNQLHAEKKALWLDYFSNENDPSVIKEIKTKEEAYQKKRALLKSNISEIDGDIETKDTDYVFLSFVLKYMPIGLIGLLMAVILSAAMSSTAGELNALASTTTIDYYKRLFKEKGSDLHYLKISKWLTVVWGILAIVVAISAHLFDNLIQLVNVLGSLFYGTILGTFLVAFFLKKVNGFSVLWAAILAELSVLVIHILVVNDIIELSYLMYNLIGCGLVLILSLLFNAMRPSSPSLNAQ